MSGFFPVSSSHDDETGSAGEEALQGVDADHLIPKQLHSPRRTFAKRALEAGASITWLSRQLGHSSITITVDIYGHFESAERLREARKLEGMWEIAA